MPPLAAAAPRASSARVVQFPELGVEVHTAQYQPTERAIEDRIAVATSAATGPRKLVVGVFDGHRGAWAAEHVSEELPRRLLTDRTRDRPAIFEVLDAEMVAEFRQQHARGKRLGRRISRMLGLRHAERAAAGARASAQRVLSGSTALVVELDRESLAVHNLGDCRGVFYDARSGQTVATEEQSAHSAAEVARLQREHPGEPHIITGGRLLGQQLATRGFGDACFKLPLQGHKESIDALSKHQPAGTIPMRDMYGALFHDLRTPPYLTARPAALPALPADYHVNAHPQNVAVLASDGLWDMTSSADASRTARDAPAGVNVAEHLLLTAIASRDGRPPGDDTSIVVIKPLLHADPC